MWIKSQNRDESESNYDTNLEKSQANGSNLVIRRHYMSIFGVQKFDLKMLPEICVLDARDVQKITLGVHKVSCEFPNYSAVS